MENSNEIKVVNGTELVPTNSVASDTDLELAIKNAERTEKLIAKVKQIAIKATNQNDWVDMVCLPYLPSHFGLLL